MKRDLIPPEDRIYAWIGEVFAHGIRRPGYPADRWAEQWVQDQFRGFGVERVRPSLVPITRAAISIVAFTHGVSAASIRAGVTST